MSGGAEFGSPGSDAGAAPRILVVDDQPLNLELARAVLEASGFEVRTADEAESMRAVLAQGFVPALVLMDIQLPGTDGLVLTRELKSNPALAGTVVAAFTAFAMPGDEERFRAAGCDAYFTKPIDVRTFAAQVRALLGAS